MRQRGRATFVTGAVLVIIAAVLIGIYFFREVETPGVAMADPVPTAADSAGTEENQLSGVEVTPENVQNVIATLNRTETYYRQLIQTNYWSGGQDSSTVVAEIWNTPEALRLTAGDEAGGSVTNMIITGDTYYLWYDRGTHVERPITEALGDSRDQILDEFQGIPSYETVLELDVGQIVDADYTTRQVAGTQEYCIYVATAANSLGYTEHYYISVSSGLLVEMETYDGEVLVSHMSTAAFSTAPDTEDVFVLPDGTEVPG